MAAMLAAAVVAASMTACAVLMVVVVAANIGIIAQISAEQCVHRCVSFSADTAVESLMPASASAACAPPPMPPQINASTPCCIRKPAKGTMAAAVGINDFRMNDLAIRSFIKLKLLGVAEMLKKSGPFFIGNCNFHDGISF